MARLGIDQVVEDHRVVLGSPHLDPQAVQHPDVELHVLADLGRRLVLEERAEDRGVLGLLLHGERYVPRRMGLDGERQPHDAVAEEIEARGLGVEAYLLFGRQLPDQPRQLLGLGHQTIVVGRGGRRGEKRRIISRFEGCPKALGRERLDALRSLRGRGEEIALTRQRVPLGRLRLGAGHLGQLPLRILSGRVRLLGGSHIVDVAQERGEIEFGIERLQLVDVGRADLQIVGRELHGHVGADGGQILGQ